MSNLALHKLKKRDVKKPMTVKKVDRFNGLTEEEVRKFTLPDILVDNLDIIFIGINPGLMSAYRRRYYAGPGNHFYKLLHSSGLLPTSLNFEQDYKLPEYGIGLTNIVSRTTRSSSELSKPEIKEGVAIIEQKIKQFKPKVAVFNGKCIYEVFREKHTKQEFCFGLQPECIGETALWVVPSSSARCSNFPRMTDKLHFYVALKKYLEYIKGDIIDFEIKNFTFDGKCKPAIPSTSKYWRRKAISAFIRGGRIANKETYCMDTSDEAIACSTEFILKEIEENNDEKHNKNEKNDEESEENNKNEDSIYTSENDNDDKSEQTFTNNLSQEKQSCDIQNKYSNGKQSSFDFVSLIKQRILDKQHVDDLTSEEEEKQKPDI